MIDSLYINKAEEDYIALFGYTSRAIIVNLNVTNCSISGNRIVGGLVGLNSEYSVVSNCYSTGAVSGTNNVGGFIGSNSDFSLVSNCYSTGAVSGTENYDGGFIGNNELNSIVSESFWDTETSGQSSSDGGTGKTTAEMKTKSTFADVSWNFDFIWSIDSDYPINSIDTTKRPKDTDGNGFLNIKTLADLRWLSESGLDRRQCHPLF